MNPRKISFVNMSIRLIEHYYAGERLPLLSFLHPKILWSESQQRTVYSGKESVKNWFSSNPPEKSYLSDMRFYKNFESAGIYRICGEYNIYRTAERIHPICRERACIIWISDGTSWKVIQVDCSIISGYFKEFLKLEDIKRNWHFLSADKILFAEARGSHCLIRGTYCFFEALSAISALEKKLDRHFIRVHRSYLVNPDYVRRLTRFEILMENGEKIPVSEKRYGDVKKALLGGQT